MATSQRKSQEQFIQNLTKKSKNGTCLPCRFSPPEIASLLNMFQQLCGSNSKLDRSSFRDVLMTRFKITDDFIMDRVFRAFDTDNDGYLKAEEWICGLSIFLKGRMEDRIRYCFCVYDLNGDGYISREEMFHMLKRCLVKQSTEEDPDEGVKELVEIVLKKLDIDHDGKCSVKDFRTAVESDSLLLESLGQCLPCDTLLEDFMQLIHGKLTTKNF
ncbi:hypothetical protein SNE40_016759 [Patella caerulea]|uniref:EF-hand domain-containing protein n=1 Tax=Patella caerulea TaxID=87958 RepID=A0AAN8PCT1_PATCE